MNYLADENVARRIVEWLRSRGDDVLYASEKRAGEIDAEWLREAEAQGRLILTSDKDFGDLPSPPVVCPRRREIPPE